MLHDLNTDLYQKADEFALIAVNHFPNLILPISEDSQQVWDISIVPYRRNMLLHVVVYTEDSTVRARFEYDRKTRTLSFEQEAVAEERVPLRTVSKRDRALRGALRRVEDALNLCLVERTSLLSKQGAKYV